MLMCVLSIYLSAYPPACWAGSGGLSISYTTPPALDKKGHKGTGALIAETCLGLKLAIVTVTKRERTQMFIVRRSIRTGAL